MLVKLLEGIFHFSCKGSRPDIPTMKARQPIYGLEIFFKRIGLIQHKSHLNFMF